MPTVNEELLDRTIEHQIGLSRYSAATVRKIIALLNATDADLVAQIAAFDPSKDFFSRRGQQRLEDLLAAIRKINSEAYTVVGRELRDELISLADYETEFQFELFEHTLPIEFDVIRPTKEMLKAAVDAKPFQGRLLKEWVAGMEAGRLERLKQELRIGYVEGESVDQMLRRVRGTRANAFKDGVLETSRRSAEAIVRTAVNATAVHAREELYKENPDLIKGVRWVSTLDQRTTPVCRARDGKIYKPGKGPRPPAHINCRSTTVPVTKSFRELGIDLDEIPGGDRASMDGVVPKGTTYSAWLRTKPADFQDDILGKKKGRLFRDGKLDLDRFVDEKGREYTLDELRRREKAAWARAFPDEAPPPRKPRPRNAKPKPPPPKPVWGNTHPLELARHEAHFAGAPKVIKDVIASTEALADVIEKAPTAHYNPATRVIDMSNKYAGDPLAYGVVWRHEYGHFIDFVRAPAGFDTVSLSVADAIEKDAKALVRKGRATYQGFSAEADAIMNEWQELDFEDVPGRDKIARAGMDKMLEGTGITLDDILAIDTTRGTERLSRMELLRRVDRLKSGAITAFLDDLYIHAGSDKGNEAVVRMLHDLIGSATLEKVGRGHGKAYYAQWNGFVGTKSGVVNKGMATEVMANYLTLSGGARPIEKAAANIARALLPNVFKALDDVLERLAKP